MNLHPVMYMRALTVRTVGQNYIAQEDVLRMLIMQQALFAEFTNQDVNYLENVLNVQL